MFSRLFGKPAKPDVPATEQAPAGQTKPEAPMPGEAASSHPAPGAADVGFPPAWDDDLAGHSVSFAPTQPMGLHALDAERALTPQQRKEAALGVVELHHHRIANTIRTLWGYKECSVYINKLIMAGGDGMGHARVGFNQDAVQAMLLLSDLHDAEFGPPDSIPAALGL